MNIMQQSACLVVNPIRGYSNGFLFKCMTVVQASDSMTILSQRFRPSVGDCCLSLA